MPKFPQLSHCSEAVRASSYGPFAKKMSTLMKAGELAALHLGDTYLLPPEPARRIDLDANAIHRYAPVDGLPALRKAIARRFDQRYGVPLSSKNIFLTPGSTGGLALAVEALFDVGDEVIVMTPSWPLIFGMLQRRGVVVREFPVGPDGVPDEPERFRQRLSEVVNERTAALYFCDPNNPSGFIYSDSHRKIFADCAKDNDLWVLSDIAYADLVFAADEPYKLLATRADFEGRVITAGTFSKTHAMAGHRLGYLAVPDTVRPIMRRLITNSTYHASVAAQEMVLAVIDQPELEQPVADSYAEGARIVNEHFQGRFAKPQGGAFVFVDLRPLGVTDSEGCLELLSRCLDVGVALSPGSVFGKDYTTFARLCYTSVPPEALIQALTKLNPILASAD